MIVKTTIFKLCNEKYKNLSELAHTMEISVSQVYRVREGKRNINQKFIIGAIKAFPEYRLSDLFYLAPEPAYQRRSSATGPAPEEKQEMASPWQTLVKFDPAMGEYAESLHKSH